jgi:O-antigen ligase
MSIVVVKFTDYGQMYERLAATEVEGGVPDTRANTWSQAVPEIAKRPVLGHGPRLRLEGDEARSYPGRTYTLYPHNIYLFLLYTVGIVGLAAYMWFFGWLIVRFRRGIQNASDDPLVNGFIRLGILLTVVFLIDELKIEFLRFALIDYWHFVFTLFAIFLGFADLASAGHFRAASVSGVNGNEQTRMRAS